MKKNTAELATSVLLIVLMTLAFTLGSCTKKEYVFIPTPYTPEETAPYVFDKSDLIGTWEATNIIQGGSVVTQFQPKKNIIIIDNDLIGFYLSNYYSTYDMSSYSLKGDSLIFYQLDVRKALKYIYEHDSSLNVIGHNRGGANFNIKLQRAN